MRRWLSCIFVVLSVVLSSMPARAGDAIYVVDEKNVLSPGPSPSRPGEVIPPSPSPYYIVDRANVLKPKTVAEINKSLHEFEVATSSQFVVGIYPKMQSQDDIAAYAVRVYQAWKLGTKSKDNGVLLLIFIEDRKVRIATGYGMEGALPDATAFSIIENDIKPRFKQKDYDGGVRAAVASIMAATKGEYTASQPVDVHVMALIFVLVIIVVFVALASWKSNAGTTFSTRRGTFSSSGRRSSGGWDNDSGWSSGSSSSGSSDSGGFSGGGGSTGGGGASGSW